MSRGPWMSASGGLVSLLVFSGLLLSGCADDKAQPETPKTSAAASDAPTVSAADALIAAGLEQIAAQDFSTAVGTFESVLTVAPGNVYALYNLGYIAQLQNKADRAMRFYNDALATQADFAPALYNLALLTESTDLDAAIELYRRVVDVAPGAAAFMRLGFALQHQGKTEEGQEFLDQGIALDPAMANVPSPTYE